MKRLSRPREKSVRKPGKLRRLYTFRESDLADNVEILPEPPSKRIRLPTTSCTVTSGDGGHKDSSSDVDKTPGISRIRTLPFRSCNVKVAPKPMQQHKTACDSFNKSNMEVITSTPGSSETPAEWQNALNILDNMFGRSESISPLVSGSTSLQSTKISAMNEKSRIPVHSTNRMCTTQTDPTDYNKLPQQVQNSELTQTSHRAEQTGSTHKPQHLNEEKDKVFATQPVSSLLLKGIVAYVEVQSRGMNLSMGVKSHMSELGATVRDTFTNDVTHVVFNDGLLSTYKKAVKKKVHMVRVLWIEECKKAQTIVSESLFPPRGLDKYQSPALYKEFRRVRSLRPNFKDTGERKIRKRRQKKLVHSVDENEPQIELPDIPTYKEPVKVPEFLRTIYEENANVRALLSMAEIGPEYEKAVTRPDSPTMSDDEDYPLPLAVRLLRDILKSHPSSKLTSSGAEAEDRKNSTHMTDVPSGAADAQGTSMTMWTESSGKK